MIVIIIHIVIPIILCTGQKMIMFLLVLVTLRSQKLLEKKLIRHFPFENVAILSAFSEFQKLVK